MVYSIWCLTVAVLGIIENDCRRWENKKNHYIDKVRRCDPELVKGWVQILYPLPIKTDGGIQGLNCVNTEGLFRIIQSIPSPKAEPMKRWLAKVGYDYPEDWIEKRMRGIAVREEGSELVTKYHQLKIIISNNL